MRISDWSSDVCSSDLPVAGSVTLEDVIRAAGGFTRQADTGAIELTWFQQAPGDSRRVPQRTTVALRRTSATAGRAPVGSIVRVHPAVSGPIGRGASRERECPNGESYV